MMKLKALILGKGSSGRAAEALLRDGAFDVDFSDGYDLVVASPGIPVKSELQLGCEELKRRGWKMLAVTGSKGKSSVVKIVADALNAAGANAVACGNYGVPVSEVAFCERRSEVANWAVVEVSSFQLETTTLPPDAFEAAAVLNLQEDHIDRHGSVAVYHGLKRKLLSFARKGFCGAADIPGREANESLLRGSYFDNEILRENGVIAAELMRVAGMDDTAICCAFRDFSPLPHRMQLVAECDGVRFVDDSKATSIAALVAGVKMAAPDRQPSVRLVAGGLPKGDDPENATTTLTERAKKVYLIGQSAEKFYAAWHDAVDCEICGTLDKAVDSLLREVVRGETVLLSPGTASFDQFKSYGERGDVFAKLVQIERKKR